MIEMTLEILTMVFAVVGAMFTAVGALGLLRLPDVYSRTHAASKSATLGVMFVLVAAMLYIWTTRGDLDVRLLLGLLFVLLTGPVGGHLISRAAHNSGVPLWHMSIEDELEQDREQEKNNV